MESTYESIIESQIFTFVVGANKKEYKVHRAAFSALSKPLNVLLNGPHKEAKDLRVEWPDVDEQTFVRFTEWAYTKSYVTEEPEIILDHSDIELSAPRDDGSDLKTSGSIGGPEEALYSLESLPKKPDLINRDHCGNPKCSDFGVSATYRNRYKKTKCLSIGTARSRLIDEFMDGPGSDHATTTLGFQPKKNKEGCEDFTGVFLCHAKLYVLGDTYDISELRQLSLYRLHATLKVFTLYPSRLNDIATLAKYVFLNTQQQDKIQDMIALYYACIVEDASKHGALKSLIDEIPDFAFKLISRMSERLQ
ncbi:hypothetical protein N0V93_005451 [Gnomoniopsis smithogilvyi]|uniref:BTB domain-containing protein n=1 Tax=Gnomoniopsis smithogilvyi TaxID=1191159 RepID=A0A9W8YUH5_9PEZI|nr:hypothetical protein N0V93_005451 [Gnomoniopsis smithogilvyi]